MFKIVKNLMSSLKTAQPPPFAKKGVQLQVERLENREVQAANLSGGALVILGTNARDVVQVDNVSYNASWIKVTFNGSDRYFQKSTISNPALTFWGYDGNDSFSNNVGELMVVAHGGNGHDTLIGGSGNDRLYGDADNDYLRGGGGGDYLYGGNHQDRLYGDSGYDFLFGEDGNDVMDAGAAGEYTEGGTGYDINQWVWTVNGTTYDDVFQGNGPTCWLDTSIASAAYQGVDFNSRISYLGNDWYRVGLYSVGSYNSVGTWITEDVNFDGSALSGDARLNPNQEGEFWALLIQRAYLESRGLSVTAPPGGYAGNAMRGLTGRSITWIDNAVPASSTLNVNQIITALNNHQSVVADTRGDSYMDTHLLSTQTLVPWHSYTVLRVETQFRYYLGRMYTSYFVVLRNPWGSDQMAGSTSPTWDNPNDGIVRVSWADFTASMKQVSIEAPGTFRAPTGTKYGG